MDTQWLPVAEAVDRVGISRQGINKAASSVLRQLGLSRQTDAGRWEIAKSAVDFHAAHGAWPREAPVVDASGVSSTTDNEEIARLQQTIVELSGAVDSAELRAALAVAGESASRLAEREARIEELTRRLNDQERRHDEETRVLEARLADLGDELQRALQSRLESIAADTARLRTHR